MPNKRVYFNNKWSKVICLWIHDHQTCVYHMSLYQHYQYHQCPHVCVCVCVCVCVEAAISLLHVERSISTVLYFKFQCTFQQPIKFSTSGQCSTTTESHKTLTHQKLFLPMYLLLQYSLIHSTPYRSAFEEGNQSIKSSSVAVECSYMHISWRLMLDSFVCVLFLKYESVDQQSCNISQVAWKLIA